MRYLAVLVLSFSLLFGLSYCAGVEQRVNESTKRMEQRTEALRAKRAELPRWEVKKEEPKPTMFTEEDIIIGVYRGLFDWGEGRSMLESKGYTWMEAETLLKIYIPEDRWISGPRWWWQK